MPRLSLTLLSSPFTLISLQSCITMVPQLHLSFPCSKVKVEICLNIRQILMVERASSPAEGHCPEPGPGTCPSRCTVHSTGGLTPRHCGALQPAGRGSRWEQGNIYSPARSDILQSSGKASIQLGIPKCLLCHSLSLLKPSLKASLGAWEKRQNSLAPRRALCVCLQIAIERQRRGEGRR